MFKNINSMFAAAAVEVAEGLFTGVKAFCEVVGPNPATDAILKGFGKVVLVARSHQAKVAANHRNDLAAVFNFSEPAVA